MNAKLRCVESLTLGRSLSTLETYKIASPYPFRVLGCVCSASTQNIDLCQGTSRICRRDRYVHKKQAQSNSIFASYPLRALILYSPLLLSDFASAAYMAWQGMHFCFSAGALFAPAAVGQMGYAIVFFVFGLLAMPAGLACVLAERSSDGGECSTDGSEGTRGRHQLLSDGNDDDSVRLNGVVEMIQGAILSAMLAGVRCTAGTACLLSGANVAVVAEGSGGNIYGAWIKTGCRFTWCCSEQTDETTGDYAVRLLPFS